MGNTCNTDKIDICCVCDGKCYIEKYIRECCALCNGKNNATICEKCEGSGKILKIVRNSCDHCKNKGECWCDYYFRSTFSFYV